MSAIQDIQRLISQSQPIPESVQRAALQEAALSGMNNAALASTLGVPEAMVSDAAAALNFSPAPVLEGRRTPSSEIPFMPWAAPQIPATPSQSSKPAPTPAPAPAPRPAPTPAPAPAPSPLAGTAPAPVNYARQVKALIEQQQPIPVELQKQTFQQAVEQGVSREQMGEFLGVAPEMISQAATDLGIADQLPPVLMGTENPAIQNINNPAAQEIIKSIPPTGTYTPEQVETVTDLINTGQVNISDVSSHFNVDPSFVMEVVSGVPKSVYAEGSFTPEQLKS